MSEPSSAENLAVLAERWGRDKSSRLFLQLAEELRRAGRIGEAIEVLVDGLLYHPDSVAGLVAMGRCRLDQGDEREAVRVLERAVERDPAQLVANKLLCEAWIRLGDAEQARSRLSIYRILNERDAEIAQLVRRIGELERPRSADPRTAAPSRTTPIFELEPLAERAPIALLDVLAPLPAVETPSWAPFAGIHDRQTAEKRILGHFQAEGIFRVAAPAPAPAKPMLRPGEATAEPVAVERAEAVHAAAEIAPQEPEAPAAAVEPAIAAPLFSLQSIGDEVEREGVEEPRPVTRAAAGETAPTERAASATLAALYLQQGHLDEAETEYRAVLAARPDDRFARAGVERIAELRAATPALPWIGPGSGEGSGAQRAPRGGGLTQRKIETLRGWLENLRHARRSGGDVS